MSRCVVGEYDLEMSLPCRRTTGDIIVTSLVMVLRVWGPATIKRFSMIRVLTTGATFALICKYCAICPYNALIFANICATWTLRIWSTVVKIFI